MDSRELRFGNHASFQGGAAPDVVQGNGVGGENSLNISCLQKGEVDHKPLLSSQFNSLLQTEDFTDVTFVVENEKFQCHRIILSARCEYFRALLFGGLREANCGEEIVLKDTPVVSFRVLLQYLYSGIVSLKRLKEEDVIDLLGLAHKYGLLALQSAIGSYLESIIGVKNVSLIYDVSCLYQLYRLRDKCLMFMDHHAVDALETDAFTNLSETAIITIISRDSFCAPEIKIFRAIAKWIKNNEFEQKKYKEILNIIRLPLISLHDLFHGVRESKLYQSDVILDAIQMKTECKVNDMPFRGHLAEDMNLAQECHGAEVLSGEFRDTLFNGEYSCYDLERGFTRHLIDEEEKHGIVVGLGRPSIINTIRLLLWDKDSRSYSYIVECSLDNQNWTEIVDYKSYYCRSWQRIHFPPKVVRYIRVIGTHNTVNRYFHLVTFQCFYLPSIPQFQQGIISPNNNVAYILESALLIEGVSRNRNALIDGNTENYDWESGYTCHQIGSGCITIQLAQPYLIGSMRMLLWDCDNREYSFYIEVSYNQKDWVLVADKRNESCRCWQNMVFEPRIVSFIKIIGTRNTANEVFHVVHFECPSSKVDTESTTSSQTTNELLNDESATRIDLLKVNANLSSLPAC